jgi:hypothetical protein
MIPVDGTDAFGSFDGSIDVHAGGCGSVSKNKRLHQSPALLTRRGGGRFLKDSRTVPAPTPPRANRSRLAHSTGRGRIFRRRSMHIPTRVRDPKASPPIEKQFEDDEALDALNALNTRAPDAPVRQMSSALFGDAARQQLSVSGNRDLLELESEMGVSSRKFNRGERHNASEGLDRRESRLLGTPASDGPGSLNGGTTRPSGGPARASPEVSPTNSGSSTSPAGSGPPTPKKKKKKVAESHEADGRLGGGLLAMFRSMSSSSRASEPGTPRSGGGRRV